MRWDFDVEYTKDMRLHLANLLWRRHAWPSLLSRTLVLVTWFGISWMFGVGAFWLGLILGMLLYSTASALTAWRDDRRAVVRFHERRLDDRVRFSFSADGVRARTEAAEWGFQWHALESLWVFPDTWVLVALGRAFAIPLDRLPPDLREFIEAHVVPLRRRLARCPGCGYDLRGQTVPRCPECGREFDLKTLDRPSAAGGA